METIQYIIDLKDFGGISRIEPTNHEHIFLEGYLIIRGKPAKINSVHFYKWADGQWHLGQEKQRDYERLHSLHGYYEDHKDITRAFKEKAIEILTVAVNEWAANNLKTISEAQDKHILAAIEQRKDQILEHHKAIEHLTDEILLLQDNKHLSTYSSLKSYYFSVDKHD